MRGFPTAPTAASAPRRLPPCHNTARGRACCPPPTLPRTHRCARRETASPKGAVATRSLQNPTFGAPGKLSASRSVTGDLWPSGQKLSQRFFCLRPSGTNMFLVGFKHNTSHHTGLDGAWAWLDFAGWMKEKGLVPSSTDHWWVPCHVSVGLQGEPRWCWPYRKPPPHCRESPKQTPKGCFCLPGLGKTPHVQRVQPKYLSSR